MFGRKLDPINQDACAFYESHAVSGNYGGIPVDYEQGEADTANLADNKVLIMRNHGLLTVGRTVDEAAWWLIAMERCCQVQLAVLAAAGGRTSEIPMVPHEEALKVRDITGTPYAGWLNFQPILAQIMTEQPDLLE